MCQPDLLTRRVPTTAAASLTDYIASSQRYQAQVVKRHAEHYRRLRYNPCNGAHVFLLVDYWPGITWSRVDYERSPKLAYHAYAESMSPCQVLLDVPVFPRRHVASRAASLMVVSDTGTTYREAVVTVDVDDVEVARHERVRIDPRAVTDLPPAALSALDAGDSSITCRLRARTGAVVATNQYSIG